MTNEQAEIQQAAREPEPELIAKAKMFLAQPQHQIGIKKARGHHPHVIDVTKCEYCRTVVAMAAFHIFQSEEERKRLTRCLGNAKEDPKHLRAAWCHDCISKASEAEVSRLRGALEGLLAVVDICQDMMPDEIVRFDAAIAKSEAALSSPPASAEREVKG